MPIKQPAGDLAGISLQERDLTLLRGLFESRVMTTAHATALYFDGHPEAAKKRLQRLKAAGVVGERPRRPHHPAVLFLTSKGFRVLHDGGALQDYPRLVWASLEKRARVSELTLRHELEVMAVKAAVTTAVTRTPQFRVVEFSTWPLLFQFYVRRPPAERTVAQNPDLLVKPDGLIRISEDGDDAGEHTFFLELDRSTEPQDKLGRRAVYYLHHYQSGGLAARHGQPRSAYKDFPFRVLMVFKNAERRNNTAERILQGTPPVLTQVWLSTFAEVINDPLGSIWIRPLDYRNVTAGTPFDPETRRQIKIYRRQPEREKMVEERIEKWAALEPANTPATA